MISQIIYTIIMALGVASGTKATSNTFYDANETKPTQNAIQSYNKDLRFAQSQEWHTTNYIQEFKKYYLYENVNITPSSTIVLDNMIIYNTTYTFEQRVLNQNRVELKTYGIYKIQNTYNSYTQFQIEEIIALNSNQINYARYQNVTTTDTVMDQAIDMTVNANTYDRLLNLLGQMQNVESLNVGLIPVGQTQVEEVNNTTTTITLQEDEIIYLIMYIYVEASNTDGDIILEYLHVNSSYQAPTTTYEIVDIPGIMFTVLSMPFSFISTAFNLTIFPNTPYQLNFANLFMVILASFILMWLIKKVFH